MKIERYAGSPIIRPDMDGRMGSNVNGPSMIPVPSWVPQPLGRYYLYFAHHKGSYIRLAYADAIEGPWATHEPGVLALEDSFAHDHIASPDVHVDDERRSIRMYYHGAQAGAGQRTRVALSSDGIGFEALPEILGAPYFRVFEWDGYHYALGMPGVFYRSLDGLTDFERGPALFSKDMRHSAVMLDGATLSVFYTNVGECPERILVSTIDLSTDWTQWKASEPLVVLEPETEYEGVDLPLEPSVRGAIFERVRQARDPGVFREDGKTYILYSVAGEYGIALGELQDETGS
jgi:hypothetical protein